MAFFINIYEKLFPPMNKYGMKLADVRQAVQDGGNLLHESFSAVNEEDLKYKMIKHNLTVLKAALPRGLSVPKYFHVVG